MRYPLASVLLVIGFSALADVEYKKLDILTDGSVAVSFASRNASLSVLRLDLMDKGYAERDTTSGDLVQIHAPRDGFYTLVIKEFPAVGAQVFFLDAADADNNFPSVNVLPIRGSFEGALNEIELVLERLKAQESWDRATAIRSLGRYLDGDKARDLNTLKADLDAGLKLVAVTPELLAAERENAKRAEAKKSRKEKAAERRRKRQAEEEAERQRRSQSLRIPDWYYKDPGHTY